MRWEVVLVRRGQLGFYRNYDLLSVMLVTV